MSDLDTQRGRRVLEINQPIGGPRPPPAETVRARKPGDYPHVPAVYLDVARRLASPMRMGPPMCDELMALVQHLFTEEEAGVVRHMGLYGPPGGGSGPSRTPSAGANRADIAPTGPREAGDRGQRRKGTGPICRTPEGVPANGPVPFSRQYRLPPIVPGIFEMMLIGYTPETMTDWHRRFVELFERCATRATSWTTTGGPTPSVRFLPVGKAIEAHPAALPSDKLEVVLDQFEIFGIGQCQCRMAMQVARPGLRQTPGELHRHGPMGRAGHRGRACSAASRRRTPSKSNARPNRTDWSIGS